MKKCIARRLHRRHMLRLCQQLREDYKMTGFHYARLHYNEAAFLAEYYRWQAGRGMSLCGNNPLTGKARAKIYESSYSVERAESIAVHKCQARFWHEQARKLRDYGIVGGDA